MSLNEAWQLKGFRKFKSLKYKQFQTAIYNEIKDLKWPFELSDKLYLDVKVGFSSNRSDLDNALKPLLDTFSDYYHWNDNKIYRIKARKFLTEKGKEYLDITFRKENE